MRFVGRFDCATPLNKIVKYNNKSEHIPKEHGAVRICFVWWAFGDSNPGPSGYEVNNCCPYVIYCSNMYDNMAVCIPVFPTNIPQNNASWGKGVQKGCNYSP